MDLLNIYNFMNKKLMMDKTGHGISHIKRVENIAKKIASEEKIQNKEWEIIQACVYLHDIIDDKVTKNMDLAKKEVIDILKESNTKEKEIEMIMYIINNMSYSKNLKKKITLNKIGQIVQDADRIDALGAVGISRAFYYGGAKGHSMYNDNKARPINELNEDNYRNNSSVINHFYEKLLVLHTTMNTEEGKKIAYQRTETMKEFLEKFKNEVEGNL
ncbi:HD domain-containing protein [Staphylococcus ureilyticus]|uniref:HD domain-containing protein n=2 Tax=Staphylococcus TaxID=1279 RepID=UPI002929D39A|nr:HD domain-containing protein [Staphylococcus ureilyticus]MDU9372681.1 HD domain-containing protein [Staphylococcus ureilyticus]